MHFQSPITLADAIAADQNKEKAIEGLDFLWMEVTPKCNLRCVHCYADSSPYRPLNEKVRLQDWIEVLNQASELGCRKVQFIGGEPTLYPGLSTLIMHARSLGFDFVEVFTNGTLLTDRLKEVFISHKVNLAISVYAAEVDVHDFITQGSGSFERTLASIQWAVNCGIPVRAAIIEMEANTGHIERTRKMLEQVGVLSIGIDRVRGIGRGSREKKPESLLKELCGMCWRRKLCISSNGQIFPCVFSRFWPVGDVRQRLAKVVEATELRTFRRTLRSMQSKADFSFEKCDPGVCLPDLECKPDKPPCLPDRCNPDTEPPQCKPDRPVCGPDLPTPCRPDSPPPSPCGPDKPPPCIPERGCNPTTA